MQEPKLISVIITAFNHARYLPQSIESVLQQDYQNKEVIVVDDGSTDNTKSVVAGYANVRYIYQENAGLSAARNTGMRHSKGQYLTFLDADDWYYPGAIAAGAAALNNHPDAAFVYGDYFTVDDQNNVIPESSWPRSFCGNHYRHLLEDNFIAMHGTVMYQRWAFNEFAFDTSLKACEDYDLYLKLSRRHPIAHYAFTAAAYRRHQNNMSGNLRLMLSTVLEVLMRQRLHLQNEMEKGALQKGLKNRKTFYGKLLCWHLDRSPFFSFSQKRRRDLFTLARYNPKLFFSYLRSKLP